MHDAIYLYARLVNMMIGRGLDYRNGTAMFQLARSVEFTGMRPTYTKYSQVDVSRNAVNKPYTH